jgi:hypothetical protein
VEDMKKSGWRQVRRPKVGSVLVWEELRFDDGAHSHMGFYIGNKRAISNSRVKRVPAVHHWTYGTKNGKSNRRITAVYWHKKLDTKYMK